MNSKDHNQFPTQSQSAIFTLSDERTFAGTVTRTDTNEYELAIDDLPEEPWSSIERLEAQAKKEDDKYLFLDVRFVGRSVHLGRTSSNTTTVFAPSTTFYDNDPENPFSLNVSSIGTNVENLDFWLKESLFSFHNPMHAEDSMDYKLQKEVGKYNFKDFELTLGLAIGGISFPRFTRTVNLRQHAYISLRTKSKDRPYTELVEVLRSLERLIGLAFRGTITSAEIDVTSQAFGKTLEGQKKPNIFPAYSIVLSNVKPSAPSVNYTEELAFTLKDVNFQQLLEKWTELEADILPMVDLFLSSTSGGSLVLENIFLNRIQAIEGFHRAFRQGNIIPAEEYEKQRKGIIEKFSGKDRSLLKKVLKHGNQLNLEQRLSALDKELKLLGIPTLMACSFDVVANTRNYYSHYESDITNICPADKLTELTYQSGQMLFAVLLIELGVDKGIARKAIRNMRTL